MLYFNNGLSVDTAIHGSNPLIDDSLVAIANDYDIETAYDEYSTIQQTLRIVDETTSSALQKFGYRIAGRELDLLADNANKRRRPLAFGNKKGYLTKDFGNEFETSYKTYQYLLHQNTLDGAREEVKENYLDVINGAKDLNLGRMETMIIEMVALLTQGRVETADYGPGSSTPNGETLFNTAHPVLLTGETFRNVLTTENQEMARTSLQDSLDILKTGVRLQNGRFVRQGRGTIYKLVTGTVNAVLARQILNTFGKAAGMYSGQANNANQINQFYFEGNLVEVTDTPSIGEVTNVEYGYGSTLGTQDYWFMMNPFVVDKQRSLKKFEDYVPVMKNYQKISSDAYVVDVRANVGVDHYYAECGIVGSKGSVAVA